MSARSSKAFAAQPTPGYARLYYEAHITVEPKAGVTYESFAFTFSDDDWRTSKFEHDDVDGIAGKWFLSCKAKADGAIKAMVAGMISDLRGCGHVVERAKIEEAVWDTKYGDSEEMLNAGR